MPRINIDVNENLIKEGLKLTHMNTKKELVNYALEELVKKLSRRKKITWTSDGVNGIKGRKGLT